MLPHTEIVTDVLVIGGGIAGFFAAIKAREQGLDVLVTDKGYAGKAGAGYASGMGYMVYHPDLGLDLDACMDAISVKGEYLNDREWTEIVFKDSWTTYQDLLSWGVEFPIEEDTQLVRGFEPFGIVRIIRRKTTPF